MNLLSMSSCSSVDRAPARCSGGHGFDSCPGLRFVLCPILVSCRLIHVSHLLSSTKCTKFIHLLGEVFSVFLKIEIMKPIQGSAMKLLGQVNGEVSFSFHIDPHLEDFKDNKAKYHGTQGKNANAETGLMQFSLSVIYYFHS